MADSMDMDCGEGSVQGASSSSKESASDRIQRYFLMLTQGCGNERCGNAYCKSSFKFSHDDSSHANAAAVRAIQLVKQGVKLSCDKLVISTLCPRYPTSTSTPCTSSSAKPISKELIEQCISKCKSCNSWSEMKRLIGSSFGAQEALMSSFRDQSGNINLLEARATLELIFCSVPEDELWGPIIYPITTLCDELKQDLTHKALYERRNRVIDIFLILLEIPALDQPVFTEEVLPSLLASLSSLPLDACCKLVQIWSGLGADYLRRLLIILHQTITIRIEAHSETWSRRNSINTDSVIANAARVIKLVYFASLLAGKRNSDALLQQEKECIAVYNSSALLLSPSLHPARSKRHEEAYTDQLAVNLGNIHPIDFQPLLDAKEFLNESVNNHIEMDVDFALRHDSLHDPKNSTHFSFLQHSFLLNISNKSLGMYYENRIRMISERRQAIMNSLILNHMYSASETPYLKLVVHRDNIVESTLNALSLILDSPEELKKQLYIEFQDEQAIDEGGVSKEFFQLIIEAIFNPDYGMFEYNEETHCYWFSPDSLETSAQFTLVGILLGLAIYNHIILDIRLPPVIYRKLLGKLGTLEDMRTSHPVLYSSLKQVLDYDGNIEEDLMLYFSYTRKSVYGEAVHHPLVEGGANQIVNQSNKREFVDLYADCVLNKLIDKQFGAFYRGFHMVTDESPLESLFSPQEVELLVCGSGDWDIQALEESTEYDGGFTRDHHTIKDFWSIVHSMSAEEQRKLLQFTTGSDRAPVGGLSKSKLVISRNGPDSDRLPTAHTCFNVLLLPEYSSKDKLRERLMLAVTHATGFGLL